MLRLDTKRFAADLMLTTGRHEIEESVPYFAIQPVSADGKSLTRCRGKRSETENEAAPV